jgi:2-hydroxy-3-oxopropionate reductase
MKIGFCGLGRLGTAMVARLLVAGHDVTVWNRTQSAMAPVVRDGARAAITPAAAAADAQVVMLCLLDGTAVEQVVFGPQGIASVGGSNILVDHSSISPVATRAFAARASMTNLEWIDAPVSGGVAGARAATLTVMAGGSPRSIERVSEPIRAYAARMIRVGDVGAGQTAKLCNQTIVSATILAIAEAVTLAQDGGIDPAQLPEIFAGGWADSTLLKVFVPRMVSPPKEGVGALTTMLKDVECIAELARATETPMPVSGAVQHTLRIAVAMGFGDADLAAVAQLFAKRKN